MPASKAFIALIASGFKQCTACRRTKALSEFPENGPASRTGSRHGLSGKCKDCKNLSQRLWGESNHQRKNEHRQAWRAGNVAHVQAKAREYASTRRARELGQFVEEVDPIEVYARDEGICGICKQPVTVVDFEVDHVIPLAKGGMHSYSNVQASHRFCNRSKGTKVL